MTQIFDSLGWALLHSLWQGGIALLAVLIFRGVTKNGAPSLRYNFQILCLFGCFSAFLVTFGLYLSGGEVISAFKNFSSSETVSQAAALFTSSTDDLQVTSQSLSISAAASAPLLGLFWCLGFAFMAVRYLAAYIITQKLRRTGLNAAPEFWQNRFRTLVLNTGVSEKVRIFISNHVAGPLTIGFFKPVVLVPAGFLMGLPRDQVEAILLHELAHIRRYDYLVNLFQTAIKTVLFFHPAIHYISNMVDIDREQACDDLAVAQSRNPQALVRGLAALRLHSRGQGFTMAADNGNSLLVDRLKRLAGSVEYQRPPEHLLMPLVVFLLIGGIYLSTTSVANAHPEAKKYQEAKLDKHNYKFETKRLNGRNITVKITEDGRRWVLADGAWVDVDKSPVVLNRIPIALPQPPAPPVLPSYKNGIFESGAFESKMNQFEVDMEYFEADLERYFDENEDINEREQERIERNAERIAEHVERETERLQDRIEEKNEREVERAEEQRERAWEQQERASEQRERNAQQRERNAKQRVRYNEQAKHSETMRYKADKQHKKYNGMRESLYSYLIQDGFLSSRSEKATLRYVDNRWTVNGKSIPSRKEGKYCDLFTNMGIKKSTVTKIEIKPNSTHIVNEHGSHKPKHSHKVTIGSHVHKDGKVQTPSEPPVSPVPPAHSKPNLQPSLKPYIQNMKIEANSNTPGFIWPTESRHITATYGQVGKIWETSHQGIDFKGEIGAPIFASADGVVELASSERNWGNRIILKHSNGYQTLYGHMNGLAVSSGQHVKAGDVIGGVGSTGKSTGTHLHFEIRRNGRTLDPARLIN